MPVSDQVAENAFTPVIQRTFRREQAKVLAAVEEYGSPQEFQDATGDFITDALWMAALATLWISDPADVWDATVSELDATDLQPDPGVQQRLTDIAHGHGREIADTNRKLAIAAVTGLAVVGWRSSFRDTLTGLYRDHVKTRAPFLATIESRQAVEVIRYEAAWSTAARYDATVKKVWRTQRDSRVRPSHQKVEGATATITTIGEDPTFLVGGARLRFPRDPLGPPGEVIGCRCYAEYKRIPKK